MEISLHYPPFLPSLPTLPPPDNQLKKYHPCEYSGEKREIKLRDTQTSDCRSFISRDFEKIKPIQGFSNLPGLSRMRSLKEEKKGREKGKEKFAYRVSLREARFQPTNERFTFGFVWKGGGGGECVATTSRTRCKMKRQGSILDWNFTRTVPSFRKISMEEY